MKTLDTPPKAEYNSQEMKTENTDAPQKQEEKSPLRRALIAHFERYKATLLAPKPEEPKEQEAEA